MIFKEDKHTELKEIINKTFLKTVSAFANFDGGSIYFGIKDNGDVVGLDDITDTRLSIENKINDTIKPLPTYELIEHNIDNKNIIELKVDSGKNTPYRYNEKSYKRSDTSTMQVDDFMLKSLLLKGMNLRFEQLPYTESELEFTLLEKILKEKIEIESLSKDVLKSLGLYKNDSFNNAAALLADKNDIGASGIDMVRFGETESIFLDRVTEDRVSLLTQYNSALDFFDKWYSPYDEVVGFFREKRIQIPREAYREAIANLLCHRLYLINAKAKISCYEDRIEITSVGGLPEGIEKEEYIQGKVSILRNEIIAEVFHRLEIIEKFATGIKRIKREYSEVNENPKFEVTKNTITVILPCIKYNDDLLNNDEKNIEKVILDILSQNGAMSSKEIEDILSIKGRTLRYTLRKMLDDGQIKKIGNARSTKYTL